MIPIEADPHSPDWSEAAQTDAGPSTRGFVAFFAGAFIWSLGSAFSHAWGEETAYLVSGVAMGLAMVVIAIATLHSVYVWVQSFTGLMIAAHAVAALFSAILNEAHPVASVRYLLLIPGISLMIAAVRLGDRAVSGARLGITLGGVIFCLYQLIFLDFGSLLNPHYRLTVFLNPNGVAFIAAMTGISLLDYGLNRFFLQAKRLSPGTLALFAGVLVCLVLCVATKSRTATLVMLAGSLLRIYLSLGATRTFLIAFVLALLSVTVAWNSLAAAGEMVAEVFQLNDRHRSIDKGTGRFRTWGWTIQEVWLTNPILGVGPGRHMGMTLAATGASSAHNGMLSVLADTGLAGALPLIAIICVCVRRALLYRRDPRFYFAITLFFAGLLESVAETMFFSIGNPGSLLFLLSVAVLSVRGPMTDAPADPQVPSADWPTLHDTRYEYVQVS
jgi:hypothetical protein